MENFFGDTPSALKELAKKTGHPTLFVCTSLPADFTSDPDVKQAIVAKEESPRSYDLIDNMESL